MHEIRWAAQMREFVFNGDNKQSQGKDASNNVVGTYFYDGEGHRVKKVTQTETVVYVYSNGRQIAEYSTATPAANPTTNYTATDMLGSPRVLTDSLGNVVSRRDFLPFGEELYADGVHRTVAGKYSQTGQDGVRKRFTGYEKDAETSLDFAEARMYANTHGRFTAVDPLLASGKSANPQTFNRYVYVLNNPLLLTDPDGLQVAFASGNVYRKGNNFAIFSGKPFAGYRRVRQTINTETTRNGVRFHLTVTPSGWTVGDRVDGAKFDAPPEPPVTKSPTYENQAIRELANGVSDGVRDAAIGIPKGIGNSPSVALNAATGAILNGGIGIFYFRGTNPLAVPNIFSYNNRREASYGHQGSIGFLAGLGFGAGVFGGAAAATSPIPEELTVYRAFGADARAQGFSWTTKNPATVNDFRNVAGLPSGGASGSMNSADFMIQGDVKLSNIIDSFPAEPLDGNIGGLPELKINPRDVTITDFSVLNQ